MRSSFAHLLANALVAKAATLTLNWDVTWVWAAPDGFGRPVIGINGAWPPPEIHVNLRDNIIINLTNKLGNETTALHYHGINQGKTPHMEGAAFVSQCPLLPGMTMTYNFIAAQTGTQWYHSHIGGQYLDGFRGPLIVHDANAPYNTSFDAEYIMTVSDWYHAEAPSLVNKYSKPSSLGRAHGAEPVPDSTLINDKLNEKFTMIPGKRYLFRIINMGGFASNVITFGGHDMTIVEMDGQATKPTVTSEIMIAAAQRYNVIVTAKASASQNFAITSAMMPSMFDTAESWAKTAMNCTAHLVYDAALPLASPPVLSSYNNYIKEHTVQPFDQAKALGPVTQTVVLNFNFQALNGASRGTVNGTTYIPPLVPTLFTALTAPRDLAIDAGIYGPNTNTVVFNNPLGIAEIVVYNGDEGAHPFHIHGHLAQIMAVGPAGTPKNPAVWDGTYITTPPTRRDVFMVEKNSYAVIRFKTGNPGIWLFHCHIEWHIEAGLVMTFVEDPIQMQELNMVFPQNMYDACVAQGMPTSGNAGGNSVDWFNMKNLTKKPDMNPWGALINKPKKRRTVDEVNALFK